MNVYTVEGLRAFYKWVTLRLCRTMIIKDYFADGLLQIAIVLSLLRSDLDSFLDTSVRPLAVQNRLLETVGGPLSGITRTDLNIRQWEFSREYPKALGSYSDHFPSVLRDLHSLSYYRRFDGISTNVDAWLVNNGGQDGATSSCERSTADDVHDDHENTVSDSVSSAPSADDTSVHDTSVDDTSVDTSEPSSSSFNMFTEAELSMEVNHVLHFYYLLDVCVMEVCLAV